MILQGQILHGINNIYTVQSSGTQYECRIKGKVLKGTGVVYKPLAAGDYVAFVSDGPLVYKGMITERLPRKSEYSRWNRKRNAPQVIAANFDILVIVASVDQPPFRPRFVDRLLVMSDPLIETVLVLNKADKKIPDQFLERMEDYGKAGYRYLLTSAETGNGMGELAARIRNKTAVFAGQSGVGKSTILNVLFPDLSLRTGGISEKYNRGRHTTNYSRLIPVEGYSVIDTPGIREIEVFGIEPQDLVFRFPEFVPFSRKCFYPSCLHREEPGCGVREAVREGVIHHDRYASYRKILSDIRKTSGY